MGKKKRKKEKQEQPVHQELHQAAAMERMHLRVGAHIEELRHTVAWRGDRDLFVYNVRVSWPVNHVEEFLLVVKAIVDGEPMIAFHSGRGLVDTMLGMSDRYRAGKLKFTPDQYPPENWEDMRAHTQERVQFLRGLPSYAPQSS